MSGSVRHREFAMASGEMSRAEIKQFPTTTLSNASAVCRDGAIAFVCMDWRHMREVLYAGEAAFTELKNLCVWNKSNGGMGSFYRSKHELVFVFKIGTAAHTNSFGLDEPGRYRTDVWDNGGISSLSCRTKPSTAACFPDARRAEAGASGPPQCPMNDPAPKASVSAWRATLCGVE